MDEHDFYDLRAMFFNCTVKPLPEPSNTAALMDNSIAIMRTHGVEVEEIRVADHDIPPGVQPDMADYGSARDDWPAIQERVLAADIVALGAPIWLGEKSSLCTRVIERLYGDSGMLNEQGQWIYYGHVGGVIVTGNEDGTKHVGARRRPHAARRPAAATAASRGTKSPQTRRDVVGRVHA